MEWPFVSRREYQRALAERNDADRCFRLAQAKLSKMEEALERIVEWSRAYPLDIFPEPDFEKARKLLQDGGMTLDAVSASNMRHVVEGVGTIAKEALTAEDK